jgi:ATP synthase protein I
MAVKSLQQRVQQEAYLIVLWQLACVIILSVIAWLAADKIHSLAVLAGGIAYCLPNLVFVWWAFRYAGAQQMGKFICAFYLGELIKLILSAVLILMIVKYLPVSLLFVLIGLIGAIVSFWIVCMWHFSRQKTKVCK